MKHLIPTIKITIFFTILLGLIYPAIMTGISQFVFNEQANGSLLEKDGKVIGSKLLAQKFEDPKYFWPRPSAVDYNPLPSGGTNLAQTSTDLKKAVEEREETLKKRNDNSYDPPQDLLFASGSGLDPHISPLSAKYQIRRVALNRSMDVEDVKKLVEQATEYRDWGIFGEPTVNVLALNLALDQAGKAPKETL
jgi:potassium-transporting ATPase KdpC subunit